MKHLILTILFTLGVSLNVFSQKAYQVISLKNGTEFTGAIIESVPNEYIRIKDNQGVITRIDYKYIKNITEERVYSPDKNKYGNYTPYYDNYNYIPRYSKNPYLAEDITGYRGFVDFGYTFGTGDLSVGRLELLTSHGMQLNNMFFIGLGTGFHYYCEKGVDDFLIPFYGDFRVNFLDGPISPILGVKAGISFDASESFEYLGFYLAPSVGVRYVLSPNFATNFTIGYSHQRWGTIEFAGFKTHLNTGGISLKVGIEF